MTILDGRKTSSDIKDEIAVAVKEIVAGGSRAPHLAAVIAGEDGASLTYVGSKVRACKKVGFDSTLVKLPDTVTEDDLLNNCLLYTSPSPRDQRGSRMPSSA